MVVSTRARARLEAAEDVAMVDAFATDDASHAHRLVEDEQAIDEISQQSGTNIRQFFRPSKKIVLKYKSKTPCVVSNATADTPKSVPSVSKTSKAAKPTGIVKKTQQRTKKVAELKTLKVVLQVKYADITPGKLKKMGIKPKRLPKGYYPYKGKSFKLGHNPWEHLKIRVPSEAEVRNVHKMLVDHHKQFEIGTFVSQPAHAVQATVTVDAAIQTILAQSTGNEMAIDAHSRLCNRFTYTINGKKHVGTIPNWHDVRIAPKEELEKVLKPGGYQFIRAKAIKALLDMVYTKNEERKAAGTQQYEHDGNPPDADNFVPGMLSLEYITDHEDDNDEKLLGRLTELPLIGFKSAMCIMAFQLKRPLFVVDTHVLRYVKWLG